MVSWLYRAQLLLGFTKSTLFLAISLLDRLILKNFDIEDETHELVAGSILLIASKFNEVYPLSSRKINSILVFDIDHDLEDYAEMEGLILAKLDYDLV